MAAPRRCSARAPRSASLATWIGTGVVEHARRAIAEGTSTPAEVRGHRDEPVGPADDADDRDADRRCSGPPAGRRARSSPPARPRSAAIAPTEVWPPRPVDPDCVDDLAAQADHGRGQRVDRDLEGQDRPLRPGSSRTTGDGRPGVPCGAARSSVDESAATSSPMRPRIALRVRPVRATSSDRESRRRACGVRGRSRSGSPGEPSRCAARARPAASPSLGLCSSLPNVCDTLVHRLRRGVKMVLEDACRPMTRAPLGDPVDGRHRPARRSIPGLQQGGPLRGRRDRVAR